MKEMVYPLLALRHYCIPKHGYTIRGWQRADPSAEAAMTRQEIGASCPERCQCYRTAPRRHLYCWYIM